MRGSLLLFLLAFGWNGLLAQPIDTLFYEDFDGGLNQFTANPGSPDAEATWRWTPTGEGDSLILENDTLTASFWGGDDVPGIISPTVGNGAAVFNSDAYDSNGAGPDGIGTGPYPTPHTGELVSPIIDCSEQDTVVVSFFQYARVLFDNYTRLEVSNDGGISWEDVPINTRVFSNEINAIISPDTWTYIDISDIAGGEEQVQIRFTWLDADYYYWIIDDVLVSGPPQYNVALDSLFYPVSNFGTPETQIATDTFGFSGQVTNFGVQDVPNLVFKASVYSTNVVDGQLQLGDELFADSTVLDVLPAGYRDSLVGIESTFPPELAEGRYVIFYETYSEEENVGDYYPFDNIWTSTFQVTADLFSKDDGFLFDDAETPVGFIFNEDYQMGNVYTMSSLAGSGFAATTGSFAAGRSTDQGTIGGNEATFLLYRVDDEVGPGFEGFNISSTGAVNDPDDDLEIVGFGNYTFPEDHDPFESIDIELATLQGDPVPLDPGARYILVGSYAGDASNVSHLFADDYDYPDATQGFISSLLFANGEWGLIPPGNNTTSPIMRMTIQLIDAVDETPLPETALSLFPNPTTDLLRMQLELEGPTEGVVIITDISGRILRWQEYDRLQNELLEFNVSSYPAGQYLIRLGTELGTKTKKFIIAR